LKETKFAFDFLFDSKTNFSLKKELCLVLPADFIPKFQTRLR